MHLSCLVPWIVLVAAAFWIIAVILAQTLPTPLGAYISGGYAIFFSVLALFLLCFGGCLQRRWVRSHISDLREMLTAEADHEYKVFENLESRALVDENIIDVIRVLHKRHVFRCKHPCVKEMVSKQLLLDIMAVQRHIMDQPQ